MMRLINALAITTLITVACSGSEVITGQNERSDCFIDASSIKPNVTSHQILADPTQPDFISNCGLLPIYVQIYPPIQAKDRRIGLSIESKRASVREQELVPLTHSEEQKVSLSPPYTEDVFEALIRASLAKLTYFKQIETSLSQQNSSADIIVVYIDFDMLEGNWENIISYVRQGLKSYGNQIITKDDIKDQFGMAEYYESSNLKKIVCGLARDYRLECIEGTFSAFNLTDADYKEHSFKQMLEIPDFGLNRKGTLKFKLKQKA